MTTARRHPFINSRNPTSGFRQAKPNFQSYPRLRYNNAREVIESNYAAKVFRLLLMKPFSVSRRCILIKTNQHSEIAPFPLSSFQKPHRRSTWQMAFTTSFPATPQWILRTTAEQIDSVCPPLTVRHASFDRVVKVLFIIIKAILSCHPTWKQVKRLRNRILLQSNWHPL